MTDYNELSFLRQLANKQNAQLQAHKTFDLAVNTLLEVFAEKSITGQQLETLLYRAIQIKNQTLNELNNVN